MSNRKKLPKDRETTDYTLEDFIEDESAKFAKFVEVKQAEALLGGEHGVMVVGTETAYVCDLVPYGKTFHAGSQDAVDNLRKKLGK